MLLSNEDIKRLERVGCTRRKFVRYDRHGFARLRNHQGFCVFYDVVKHGCEVYEHRPFGCRIYPVLYSEQEGIAVDDLCPMKDTLTARELRRKGKEVVRLLQKIDIEAKSRRNEF